MLYEIRVKIADNDSKKCDWKNYTQKQLVSMCAYRFKAINLSLIKLI